MLGPERTLMHKIQLPGGGAIRIECFEGSGTCWDGFKTVDVLIDHPDGTDQLLYTVDHYRNRIRSMIFEKENENPTLEMEIELRKKAER